MKKRNMIYSLAVAGILCAMTNVDAASFGITQIAATNGTLSKVVTKNTNEKKWTAKFDLDGKVNTMILYMYDNPSTTLLGDNIIVKEGGGPITKAARGQSGESVKVVWRDYEGNAFAYTCKGVVNVY